MPYPSGASTATNNDSVAEVPVDPARAAEEAHGAALARELEREQNEINRRRVRRESLIAALGTVKAADDMTAMTYRVTDANRAAYAAAVGFDPSKDNLYLSGPTGTGKTHLAVIALRRFSNPGILVKTPYIMRAIRGCDSAREEQDLIDYYAGLHALAIDDLGVAKDTPFALSILYEIVDARYMDNRGGLIITSNFGLDMLAEKMGDDRIPSRLNAMCKRFSFAGKEDYRAVRK